MSLPSLDHYLSILTDRGAKIVSNIAPGQVLGREFADCAEIDIHPEVIALWARMNGVLDFEGQILDDLWFDGQYFYFSIGESRADYQVTLDLVADDPTIDDYFPRGFVPVGSPGDGSRLLVNCRTGSPTYGAVYDLMHGMGARRLSASLDRYFETLCAFFEHGALSVNEAGQVDIDFEKIDLIGVPMNPGCDGYDTSLTPAYETFDWR